MAQPGVGYRLAADVLMEVSLHLVEQVCYCSILSVYGPGGWGVGGWGQGGWGSGVSALIQPSSTTAMYPGAMIVIGWGLSTAEVVTIQNVLPNGYIFTTPFANTHNPGETILGPTFPYQETTDPAFTQAEMLGYLSRANNEFLADCPIAYAITQQGLLYGQPLQSTPANCIEINRIAASQIQVVVTSLTRTSGEVTCVTASPHGLQVGSTFTMQQPTTAGFSGVFQVDSVPSTTSFTYPQDASDGSAVGGSALYFNRMYESTQAEFSMANRTWRNDYLNVPTAWAEDRAGLYKWYTNGKPSSNFPVELLMSIRDTDTLGLLDGFLYPDLLVYIVKYKTLQFCFEKDGIQQDPARAAYCKSRYDRGVMSVNRYLLGYQLGLKAGE